MNPGTVLDAIIESIRFNSDLVDSELDGDGVGRVRAYRDRYATETNIQTAILSAPKPSILCAYGGRTPGKKDTIEVARHKYSLYFRARDTSDDSYFSMYEKLVHGETINGVPWQFETFHIDCYPPEDIKFARVVNAPDDLDFWELSFFLIENGG